MSSDPVLAYQNPDFLDSDEGRPLRDDHLRPGDLDALWAYVIWLRSET